MIRGVGIGQDGVFGGREHWVLKVVAQRSLTAHRSPGRFIFILFYYVLKINLFLLIYFWLCQVFVAARRLSLVAASGGYSSLWCAGFSLQWLLLLHSTGSRCTAFSSCGTQAQQLWHTGLVAPRHVGSSRTRARTRVPCIGRRILNHCTTREAPTKVR